MTDKQIIIDDLDTRCPYHCSDKIGQCNNPSQETPHTYCIGNKDCIYKLYARKEQECEELTLKCSQLEESFKETADGLLKIQYALADHCNKYSKTLAEIKEIIEPMVKNGYFVVNEIMGDFEKILQKINEVENEKNNS